MTFLGSPKDSISILAVCRTISGLQNAELRLKQGTKEATGILRITTVPYFAKNYIIPFLAEFMLQNPYLTMVLEVAERFPNLLEENIDLLFGVSREGLEGWVRKKMFTTRYILCASPQYLKQNGVPKKPEELLKHRYITHIMRDPNDVITFKQNKRIKVEPFLYLNDSQAMAIAAAEGLGIVNLHDYNVKEPLANGKLIEILREFQESQIPVYFYYKKTRYLQPKIRKFIDYILPLLG